MVRAGVRLGGGRRRTWAAWVAVFEERRESRADQGKSDGDSAVLDRGSRNSQALDVGRYRIARDQDYRLPSWHSVQVQVAGCLTCRLCAGRSRIRWPSASSRSISR